MSVWPFFGWLLVGVSVCDLFRLAVSECECCGLLSAGCGWVWLSVTFFWQGVGGCE